MRYFLLLSILTLTLQIIAQEPEGELDVSDTLLIYNDIFELDKPLELTLKYDIKEFQKNKSKKGYMDAELLFKVNDSIERSKNVRIKARGNFRNQFCAMPPFYINIKRANVANPHLANTSKIKFVTHCNNSMASGDYLVKEYLCYKMYNIISDYCFRAQLVKITYIDTGRKNKKTQTWGFIIEPEKMMADRLNAFAIKMDNLGLIHISDFHIDKLTIFNYMIGNSDYSITGRHNIKILKSQDHTKPMPKAIPYDFDYSGFVNAYYAVPGENLGIKSVTERYYLGACRTDSVYNETIAYFKSIKPEIIALISNNLYLSDRSKKEALDYIESFYTEITLPRFFDRRLRSTCR